MVYRECLTALLEDPDTAAGVLIADLALDDYASEGFAAACRDADQRSEKLLLVGSHVARLPTARIIERIDEAGIPSLEGTTVVLRAVKNLFAHRDRSREAAEDLGETLDPTRRRRWTKRLRDGMLGEAETYELLADYGIPSARHALAGDLESALAAAQTIGYPVALKTARADIAHKSDVGGVKLAIASPDAFEAAYRELSATLGPQVLVARMASPGLELICGILVDDAFGPIVMVGGGGRLVEHRPDVRFGLAPMGGRRARRLLERLAIAPLFAGARGLPPVDLDALARMVSHISLLGSDLRCVLRELEVNPIIAETSGPCAVDALVRAKAGEDARRESPPIRTRAAGGAE
jgi:acyl-CoA synthetase (NDP forming)